MKRLAFALAGLLVLTSGLLQAAAPVPVRVQIVDERGMPVRDAVVEILSSGASTGRISFPWRMAMAQKGEQFVPGTLIVARGSTVAFPNLDRVRHSVYSFSKPAKFEIELYGRDQTRTQGFAKAGTVALGCNIHDQMRGYIRVVDTPFASKTDANGYVALDNVPGGAAQITVWHPRLRAPAGELRRDVSISGANNRHKIAVRLR
ncbi:methylamine utilization protein [Erythrobacter litoralis]|uniref:methylamine utilization protein n=1 Tax=Erythrobacter litoralis TaxID=39960 RepID=UPI002434B5DB|nr:methylamine utilization protein [Erythrobacter litoralis]MDG6078058.1 methylamine utilization protein [Erythrobacter litoralis]